MSTIVVTWVSFNHDPYERRKDGAYIENGSDKVPGSTLELLFNPASPVAGKVDKLYIFARRPRTPDLHPRAIHPREEDVVRELQAVITKRVPGLEILPKWWDTDRPPTDHEALFLFTAEALAEIRRESPKANIVVNLSPGTPAMQTVMLLALQARIAGDRVRAYQGTPRDKRENEEQVVREVPWNLLALLSEMDTDGPGGSVSSAPWTIDRARSARMREVATMIELYGGSPFPVLLIGARGTGKTEIARRLRSQFRAATAEPDTAWNFHLNCAEFRGDATMLRSALFGYVKGAHSTAVRDVSGVLENAVGDCVFLDEIHWMDPQAQGLLLLALQRGGHFKRIGADTSIKARFRLLAATNQTRAKLREKLTPDFLDRITDLVIELPELRDCREDIGEIWKSVVWKACDEFVHAPSTRVVTPSGQDKVEALVREFQPHNVRIERSLCDMRLPGNFRDLERLARRLLVGGRESGLGLSLREQLVRQELERLRKEERVEPEYTSGSSGSLLDELPTLARCEDFLREVRDMKKPFSISAATDEWERRLYLAARAVAGSGASAARLLGAVPRTFNARMEKWSEE
jgi:transcriptional regulator with AAA-type ATPase domain